MYYLGLHKGNICYVKDSPTGMLTCFPTVTKHMKQIPKGNDSDNTNIALQINLIKLGANIIELKNKCVLKMNILIWNPNPRLEAQFNKNLEYFAFLCSAQLAN